MITLWNAIIYQPIYNALIALAHLVDGNVAVSVILLTIIIRLLLLPLSKKSIIGQYKMRAIQPKVDALKAKQLPKQEESQQLFALYKEENINPLSGCLFLLIQLPILFALYFSFSRGVYQPQHLYHFLTLDNLRTMFLGIDITKPFIIFAILAGLSQMLQAFFAPMPTSGNDNSFQGQFAKSLSLQTKFILPLIIMVIASRLAAAVSLYWIVTNIFSVLQELYFRKQYQSRIVVQ